MTGLATTVPEFVETAHRIVWCPVATIDASDRRRTGVVKLKPWRSRVVPESLMRRGVGELLTWSSDTE